MEVGRRYGYRKFGRQSQVLFLLNQLNQPCQLNQPYLPAIRNLFFRLPNSHFRILLYALCPLLYALFTRNPQRDYMSKTLTSRALFWINSLRGSTSSPIKTVNISSVSTISSIFTWSRFLFSGFMVVFHN